MKNIILILSALLLFAGCASKHDVTLVGFNTEGVLKGVFDERENIVTVTMPDGEVLSGGYSSIDNENALSFQNTIGFSSGSRYHRSGGFGGVGIGLNFGAESVKYALLTSETSPLKMEILITIKSWSQNGFGEAKTNDDRIYKIQF